jgi:predicted AlkP superfamily pyrophosphatase or phosphodiesterase
MKKIDFKLYIVLVLTVFSSVGATNSKKTDKFKKSDHHVIVLSWDGFGLNVYNKTKPLKNLGSLIEKGAFATKAYAILPTSTLPNHASMISGLETKDHGIFWNDWVPQNGLIKVPTIFDLAKSKKLSTALVVGKEKFRHFNNPKTVDQFVLKDDAQSIAEAAAEIIVKNKPNLLFIHFPDPDRAGHKFGWLSPEQIKAVELCDLALKKIIDAVKESKIENTTSWIITADHGGHDRTHGTELDSDRQIPWILSAQGLRGSLIEKRISTTDTAAQAADFLGLDVPTSWVGRPAIKR